MTRLAHQGKPSSGRPHCSADAAPDDTKSMERTPYTQRLLQGAARWLVTAAVILSPWLFGCAEPWAYLLMCECVAVGTALWLLSLLRFPEGGVRAPLLTCVLCCLALFVGLQLLPLPPSVVQFVNPLSARIGEKTAIVYGNLRAAEVLGGSGTGDAPLMRLALAPAAARRSLYLFSAYLGTFLVMANTMRRRRHLRQVAVAILFSAFVMAVLGVVHKFSGSQKILWFHESRYGGNVFGPFTNRNHFAAHMNMLFGIALGMLLSAQGLRQLRGLEEGEDRLALFSSWRASALALTAFSVLIIAGASCATLSRGATLSLALTVALLAALAAFRRGAGTGVRVLIAVSGAVLLGMVLWMGRGEVVSRLGSLGHIARNPERDFRTIVTFDTLRMFVACRGVGCGFGGFRHAYAMFQTPSLAYRWLHAHNDWAQLLAEGGLVGTMLFLAAVGLWIRRLRLRLSTLGPASRLFTIGLLGGLATIALHSLVDYGLHKPGNAFLLSAMAGMAMAAAYERPRWGEVPAEYVPEAPEESMEEGEPTKGAVATRVLALAGLVVVTALLLAEHGEVRGEFAFARFLYLQKVAAKATSVAELRRTVAVAGPEAGLVRRYARHNADALGEVSGALLAWARTPALDRELRLRLAEKAAETAWLAIQAAPADYLAWLWMARVQLTTGHWDEADVCRRRARDLVLHPNQVRLFALPELKDEDLRPIP